jgi:hypothetical protein
LVIPEKEKLKKFMNDVKEVMDFVIYKYIPHALSELEMPSGLYGYLKAAWEETKNSILPLVDREIDAIEEKALSQHGLTGPQLEWKLEVYNYFRGLFIKNPTKRLLTKLIDAIDDVLDSLSSVCGVVGAVKEIKDSLRPFLD